MQKCGFGRALHQRHSGITWRRRTDISCFAGFFFPFSFFFQPAKGKGYKRKPVGIPCFCHARARARRKQDFLFVWLPHTRRGERGRTAAHVVLLPKQGGIQTGSALRGSVYTQYIFICCASFLCTQCAEGVHRLCFPPSPPLNHNTLQLHTYLLSFPCTFCTHMYTALPPKASWSTGARVCV